MVFEEAEKAGTLAALLIVFALIFWLLFIFYQTGIILGPFSLV